MIGQRFSELPFWLDGETSHLDFRSDKLHDFPHSFEGGWLSRDGTIRTISWSNTALKDSSGNAQWVICSGLDITERKQAQLALLEANDKLEVANAQLTVTNRKLDETVGIATEMTRQAQAANRTKDEFLTNMSHELRTPMNAVLGMAEILEETELDEEQLEYVAAIKHSGASLLTIITEILDFTILEAGKLQVSKQPFELRLTIEDAVETHLSEAEEKGLDLQLEFMPDLHNNFIGDAGHIRQIMRNLLTNAIKFTKSGYVFVGVEETSRSGSTAWIEISVTDTGIGISKENLPHIFDKFTQLDASNSRSYGGTGLGLAVSSQLATCLGGSVKAKSIPGEGSTFKLQIPLTISGPIPEEAIKIPEVNVITEYPS